MFYLILHSSGIHAASPQDYQYSCEIINYGLFSEETGNARFSEKEKPSVLSKNIIGFIKEATEIPLKMGTHFGFSYIVKTNSPQPALDLKFTAQHPEMQNPKTNKVENSYEYETTKITDRENFFGFIFEEEFELVEGDWLFQILYEDSVLCQKGFKVYTK